MRGEEKFQSSFHNVYHYIAIFEKSILERTILEIIILNRISEILNVHRRVLASLISSAKVIHNFLAGFGKRATQIFALISPRFQLY
jgi:hypothetical protein